MYNILVASVRKYSSVLCMLTFIASLVVHQGIVYLMFSCDCYFCINIYDNNSVGRRKRTRVIISRHEKL